jgi:hypothetical protein
LENKPGFSRAGWIKWISTYFHDTEENAEEMVRGYETDLCHLDRDEYFVAWALDTCADCLAFILFGEENILENRDAMLSLINESRRVI